MTNQQGSAQIAVLGDPTRRDIFELGAKDEASVGEIAKQLPVTRSAVSQHLRVLQDAGLVRYRSVGTRNLYSLDAAGIEALRQYLDRLWRRALSNFKDHAEKTYREKKEKQ